MPDPRTRYHTGPTASTKTILYCGDEPIGQTLKAADAERIVEALNDAPIAESHIERGNDETMRAWAQVRALKAELEQQETAIRDERQAVAQLLGACGQLLDNLAANATSPNLQRAAGDLAQRIVDETGHQASGETAPGPALRAKVRHLTGVRDELAAELHTSRGHAQMLRSLAEEVIRRSAPGREHEAIVRAGEILDVLGPSVTADGVPTWAALLASHSRLLDERDESTRIIKEMGAEIERLKVQRAEGIDTVVTAAPADPDT